MTPALSAEGDRDEGAHRWRAEARRWVGKVVRGLSGPRVDLPLATWRLSRLENGALALDGVVLGDLLARGGSPLHVVDAVALAANARRFLAVPPGSSRGCEVFYSYKTDPVPGVLRRLKVEGLGAEVASDYEFWLALRMGVEPKSIIFNGPTRSDASLLKAVEYGVGLINVNWQGEIAPLAALAARASKRANLGIRIVPPGEVGGQFGVRVDTGQALAAFREAQRCPGLRVMALHAHRNAEISTRSELDDHLTSALRFADELRAQLGLELEILDVGGNLACPTVSHLSEASRRLAVTFRREPLPRPPSSVLSIEAYVARVVERVGSHYAARGRPPPRIFLEPGRAMTSNAQMLLCRVERLGDRDDKGIWWGILDGGHNAAEPVTSEFHQLFPLTLRPNEERRTYRLTGPNCTLADQLYSAWRMPALKAGDGLAIMDSGAYFVPFATCFSRPRAGVMVIDRGRVETLRRAETFEDLVAYDDLRVPERASPRVGVHPSRGAVPRARAGA